ncbi:MAG: chalcone isomerase family protein [Halieaceae bacterium]
MKRSLCCFALWAITALAALAALGEDSASTVFEATPPQSMPSSRESLSLSTASWPLVGEARLKVLLWKVYDSALYTPSGRWLGAGPYQLSLTYLRDIPVEQLIKETRKAWDEQNRVHPEQENWLQALAEMWPDISAGDNLVFGVGADDQNQFWFNGQSIGGIDHPDFAAFFGGIWLSEDSPRPALRARLIGEQD